LGACYDGRDLDRAYASTVHISTVSGLRVCRREQVRAFGMGVAIGAGGVGAIAGGVALGRQ
jgi:hypothetical protein